MSEAANSGAGFLYPFLQNQEGGTLDDVLAGVRGSTLQKCSDVVELRQNFIDTQAEKLVAAAAAMAAAFANGNKLLAFGNGGSATDAQDIAADFMQPPAGRRPLPALSLTNDIGVVTGVGNDVGFDNVFARQVISLGQAGDIALGISTSGESANVVTALKQAQKMGLLTIGLAGYDGGKMARMELDFCLIVSSTYVPRIQEAQATIYHTLWELVHQILEHNQ